MQFFSQHSPPPLPAAIFGRLTISLYLSLTISPMHTSATHLLYLSLTILPKHTSATQSSPARATKALRLLYGTLGIRAPYIKGTSSVKKKPYLFLGHFLTWPKVNHHMAKKT